MKNKTWFVTGTTQGFGLELVKQLLEQGYNVVATTRNLKKMQQTVNFSSDKFLPLQVNLLDEESISIAVHEAITKFGSIDVLVNNAGFGTVAAIEEATKQEVQANFDVNVFALLSVTRTVLPFMREAGSGHIINISSVFGLISGAGWGIYCATKFAVEALSEALAEEIKPFGVKVSLIEPGYFRTHFLNTGSVAVAKSSISAYTEMAAMKQANLTDMPGNQIGDPVKAASVIISIAQMEEPPFRLLLGSDALQYARHKMDMLEESFKRNQKLSLTTDFSE